MNTRLFALAAASMAVGVGSAQSQTTATTDPVGYMKVGAYDSTFTTYNGVLAQSDSVVDLPFTLPPAFTGTVASVSGNTITVNGTPNFTANQYGPVTTAPTGYTDTLPPRYYVLLAAGSGSTNPKEGSYYSVTANGTNTLTVDLNGDTIATVPVNAQLTIIPYWTLATVFPTTDENVSYVPSANAFNRQMEIQLPDLTTEGFNLPNPVSYYFIDNTATGGTNKGWRRVGRPSTADYSIDPILPDTYFNMRNLSSTTTNFTVTGSVLTKKFSTGLATSTTTRQDNYLALPRPAAQTLNQTGLFSSGAFGVSTSAFNRGDELYVYDNSVAQINKPASSTYYYINNGAGNVGWRKVGSSSATDVGDTATLPPGTGFYVRKAISDGTTKIWTNSPNY